LRRPKALIVRQLKQRWGSMSPGARLMLNRRLIEAPSTPSTT
jgi:predicted metal-dependent hydrolase